MEAELYAAVYGVVEAMGAQSVAKDLGTEVKLTLGIDSSAAAGLLGKEGLGKAKHVDTQWLWVQQEVRRKRVHLRKIPGSENAADLMTKALSQPVIDKHMRELGFVYV